MTYQQRKKQYPSKPENCLRCGLFENCKSYKLPYKRLQAGKKCILIVVDNPSQAYDMTGQMKTSKVWDTMDKAVKEWVADFSVYITHATKCKQKEGTIKIMSVRQCAPFLQDDIDKLEPNTIIAVGATAKAACTELNVDYHYVTDINSNLEDVLNRTYHELHKVLTPIPITTNLSIILLKAGKAKEIAVDFEWNPDTGIPHSVGLACGNVAGGFILDDHCKQVVQNIFLDPKMLVIGHNITEDCRTFIDYFGNGIQCEFMDTLILKRHLAFNIRQGGLKYFAEWHLMLENYWYDIDVEDFKAPTPKLLRYTAGDAFATWLLYKQFESGFEENWKHMEFARSIDMDMVLPVAYMLHAGIKIDKKKLKSKLTTLRKKDKELTIEFETKYKTNPSSPQQVLELLQKRKHKITSTGVDILSKLNDDVADKILEYRKTNKLITTYLDKLPNHTDEADLVHCRLHIASTITGRMSSSNPNMQNIPPQIRPIFKSVFDDEGTLVTVDASQSELRCLAYLSGSEYLIDAYKAGKDMHTLVAELAGIERKNAKTLNFAYVYGSSEKGLIAQLIQAGVKKAQAKGITHKFMDTMEELGIMEYQSHLLDKAKKMGYTYSVYGRIGTRLNPTQIVNFPVQSFSADLNKMRIIYVFNRLREEKLISHIWLEFHDAMELDVYLPEKEKVLSIVNELNLIIPDVLNKNITIPLPLDIKEHGPNWK